MWPAAQTVLMLKHSLNARGVSVRLHEPEGEARYHIGADSSDTTMLVRSSHGR
jgi:hypothetical protein